MADEPDLVAMTIEVVANYVAHNMIAPDDVPSFIAKTHAAIKLLNAPEAVPAAEEPAPAFEPAVTVRKSIASREHILSLIDGKPYKTLKRHLSGHGLTPAQYRERYGLKADYPMVAPAYSDHRREVARTLGLGRQIGGRAVEVVAPVTPEPAAVVEAPIPAKRGRKPAAPKPVASEAAAPKSKVKGTPLKSSARKAVAKAETSEPATQSVAPKSRAAKAVPAKLAAPKKASPKPKAPKKTAPAVAAPVAEEPPAS